MIKVDVSGAAHTVNAKMTGVGKREREWAIDAVTQATDLAETEAIARVPVLTGQLRDSIEKEMKVDDDRIEGHVYAGRAGKARYALFVERGTKTHGEAQPYLKPALEAAREWLYQEARRRFGRA